jgi:hypothetical protein
LFQANRLLGALLIISTLAQLLPGQVQAQELTYAVGVVGGVGGTDDTDEFSDTAIQAHFSFALQPRTHFVVRAGELDLAEGGESTPPGSLGWITVSTEYVVPSGFFDSGLFIGLGYYRLESDNSLIDESGLGLTLGVTGDFPIIRHLALRVELAGHYADLDSAQIILMAQAGLSLRF